MGKKFHLSLRKMRRFASLQSWYAKESTCALAAIPSFFLIYQWFPTMAYLLLYCLATLHYLYQTYRRKQYDQEDAKCHAEQ
jgi:hypothetical protein